MQFPLSRRRQAATAFVSAAVVALAACSGDSVSKPDDPNLPGDPGVTPQVTQAAWRIDVSTAKKTIKITAPSVKASSSSFAAALAAASGSNAEPSLLGADAINLVVVPGTYSASGVGTGGASPSKVLVKFDVQVVNLLSSVDLITPTFPVPPGAGVFMFPFATNVTTTSGGATGSGNDVIVDLPNRGQVAPSGDFDGAPYNWFNDTGCPAGANDCYRYETYPSPISAGATTGGQTIGFEIDPTVSNFSAKLIVAADLQNSGPAVTRTVSGTVTSPQTGNITGGTVSITGAGTASPAAGAYSIANVGGGAHTVSYTPPAGCVAPASQAITITSASPEPVPVNFTVTCNAPTGTVTGQIDFATGSATPSLTGVAVTVTPSATGTSPSTGAPGAAGAYSIAGVQVGTGADAGAGTVSFANLPAGCSFSGSATGSYTGLTSGGSVAASAVTLNCVTPTAPYPLVFDWTGTGTSRTLTITIDMNAQNSPLNNGAGADLIGGFQGTLNYPTARLSAPTCTQPSPLTGVINSATAGQITFVLSNVSTGAGGLVTLATCTFTNTGTGPTPITLDGLFLLDPTGSDEFESRAQVTLNPVP